MNTRQIDFYGGIKLKNFLGTFPCNFLRGKVNKKNFSIVVNTCTSDIISLSCHWCAIIKSGKVLYFFDSLGGELEKENQFIGNFLRSQSVEKIITNKIAIQDDKSSSCGLFVLCFLNAMDRKRSMIGFLKSFDLDNLWKNDKIVAEMFKELFLK